MTVWDEIRNAIMADAMNASYTENGIPPLYTASRKARIVIVGQAPGRQAEETRLIWNDLSGDRLREWMGVTRAEFYDSGHIALLPMDFYFPGKSKSGDLPPRKGFAEKWHPRLLAEMPDLAITFLIGSYAQKYYLGERREKNLTETVRHFDKYLPAYLPLVHPSPLNQRWLKKNPWFETDVVRALRDKVQEVLR